MDPVPFTNHPCQLLYQNLEWRCRVPWYVLFCAMPWATSTSNQMLVMFGAIFNSKPRSVLLQCLFMSARLMSNSCIPSYIYIYLIYMCIYIYMIYIYTRVYIYCIILDPYYGWILLHLQPPTSAVRRSPGCPTAQVEREAKSASPPFRHTGHAHGSLGPMGWDKPSGYD